MIRAVANKLNYLLPAKKTVCLLDSAGKAVYYTAEEAKKIGQDNLVRKFREVLINKNAPESAQTLSGKDVTVSPPADQKTSSPTA